MRILFYSFLIFLSMVGFLRSQQVPKDSPFTLPRGGENSPLVSDEKRKIVITGKALEDSDILVEEGDVVSEGELLIDRQAEKISLESQRSKIIENLSLLNKAVILKPIAPRESEYPTALPAEDYSLEELKISAIARRCGEISDAIEVESSRLPVDRYSAKIDSLQKQLDENREAIDKAVELKKNLESLEYEMHYLQHQQSKIDALAERGREVERAIAIETDAEALRRADAIDKKLSRKSQLESAHLDCQERLKIAKGELINSKYKRKLIELNYQRSLALYEQEQDKARQFYQRDIIAYEESVQQHRSRIFALETTLKEIEYKLANLVAIRAPYSGKIIRRRSKDSAEGYINVEMVLLY